MNDRIANKKSSAAHQTMKDDDDTEAPLLSISTNSSPGIATPLYCEFENGHFWGDFVVHDAAPQAGDTYIIKERVHGRVITVIEGRLQLETRPNRAGSWRWLCTEKDGFLGFRNTVSGRYLGHNSSWNMVVNAMNHKHWENFHARRQPVGGYTLLAPHWSTMRQISIGEDNTLVAGDERGTVWEFMKLEDD
ncbi:hypothetical protein BKA56DRAFT_733848 [Ilyonectria sp. MPI-CAGE-AT-0026]|nr:hypothetical protein BKA56DRAFT_733848 [Ilyonectria sp. MPI-CAGE-AT-0026]